MKLWSHLPRRFKPEPLPVELSGASGDKTIDPTGSALVTAIEQPQNVMCQPYLGDNCIKNFHFGRYIVGYTVRNLVLQRRVSGAVKRDFRPYFRQYTSLNKIFEYGYPHANALLQSRFYLEHCKPHIAARHPTKCDVNNDIKLFPTVSKF